MSEIAPRPLSLPDPVIEPARAADLPAVLALLAGAGLPEAGLADHLATLLVARGPGGATGVGPGGGPGADALAGCAGLEVYADGALLRSVAVAPAFRGRGLGGRLTRAALERAAARGVRRVYLLTTTAEAYFPRFGFRPVRRAAVPPGVRRSPEFTHACPASARALVRVLDAAPAPPT